MKYFRSRAKALAVSGIIVCLFTVSWLLFDMPGIALVYPLVLSLLTGAVALALDFAAYRSRHGQLMRKEIPAPAGQIEADYQQIIEDLKEESKQTRLQASADYNNMIEYYTTWAHQIKTPIAAMRLNLQSEDTELSRKLGGDLKRIEAYVEMVLGFLRLDSDSTDYLIREYDLDEIIRPVLRRFSGDFINKKLKLDYEPVNYRVLTDGKWLAFILEQVISNAVKYTSEGGVRIYMNPPGVLCIEDTGMGISTEDLPRIFENGFTGFHGREDKRASGIGLYLCKRAADNLGHGIRVESRTGVGTILRLDLGRKDLEVE